MKKLLIAMSLLLTMCSVAQAREQIRIVGSSTVGLIPLSAKEHKNMVMTVK